MAKNQAPYTPMMMQYLGIKKRYPDTLIFFRLGDFYELFFEDATIASRELSLVLTGKNAGADERVPMCGVPHHASKQYIAKLVNRGYKVGIVEQLEDPSLAKGIVDRDVTQIFTPGAFIDTDKTDHNFIAGITQTSAQYIIVYADIATGDVLTQRLAHDRDQLTSFLYKFNIKEVIVDAAMPELESLKLTLETKLGILVSLVENIHPISVPDILDQEEALAYRYVVSYLTTTQKRPLAYFKTPIKVYKQSLLKLDATSLDNLEIIAHARQHDKHGSLYWLLDQTVTPMGSRLLKDMLMHPSADLTTISYRHDIVGALIQNYIFLDSVKNFLQAVYDIPRILSRINYRNANARDLIALKKSLGHIPDIIASLHQWHDPVLKSLASTLQPFPELVTLLEQALEPLPPVSIKEGGMFKHGYHPELDQLLSLSHGGKQALLALEVQEKNRTGIKNLKVGFNKVFGYYIEISNGQLNAIKPEFGYERRQTLANGERFINPELKALESKILSAEEQQLKLEETLFLNLLDQLTPHTVALQALADAVALIDVMVAFAFVSYQYRYQRPVFTQKRQLHISNLRHPIIEKVMQSSRFVANDIVMDESTHTLLITGPNMGGKSTFMRQVALAVVMAQAGCFIAADHAEMMIFDAVFTRIGATDDLLGGQSTFMMEMSQTNFALTHATSQSLLIFDEIGRGTATFDGMALAQSIIEYIDQHIRAKTLFSTHYHELTQLSTRIKALKNVHVTVAQDRDHITFLYQVKPGSMNQSFGIHVARLAQLPESLIHRANEILLTLEKHTPLPQTPITMIKPDVDNLKATLRKIDPDTLTPIEALTWLYNLKKMGE